MDEIRQSIARTKASTQEGMLAKARLAALDPISRAGIEADCEAFLRSPISTPLLMGMSLVLDILRMDRGQA